MDVQQKISEFLRDAQYRIAELTNEIVALKKKKPKHWKRFSEEKVALRMGLVLFIDLLYESNQHIKDGSNYLSDWEDAEIIREIDQWCSKAELNPVVWLSFTGYNPSIFQINNGGGSLPTGVSGQYIVYNASNVPVSVTIDPYGGVGENETIDQYFNGRS